MEKGVINSIKIEGVKGEGDYDLSDNKWDLSNSTAAGPYTVSFDGEEGKVEGQRALTGGKNDKKVLMMIPQTLDNGAKVTINFTPAGGTDIKKASFPLGGTTWDPGRHITYVLSTTKLLNLNMGTIAYPDGWESVNDNAVHKIKSSYTNGDAIGMYVVDKYNKVIEENLKFTYDGSQWTVAGKEFKGSPQYNYFVYYPYQEGGLPGAPAKGTPNINVTSAENFFAKAIDTWKSNNIAADQSTLKKMNDCDLQIGKASLDEDGCSVSFKMEHAMGLAEITLGAKTFEHANYKLFNYDSYTWTNKTTFHAYAGISGYSFYQVADYRYVAVVKPGETTGFSCGNTADADAWNKVSVTPAANGVARVTAISKRTPESYILYKMDVGDIYYSDGAITKPEDISAARANGKTPIGVIGYLGNDKWTESGTGSGYGGHALVLCLKNIGSKSTTDMGETYRWYSSNEDCKFTYVDTGNKIRGSSDKDYGSGYKETVAKGSAFEAANAAKNYTSLPAPRNKCTGWFLPSAGQYYAVMSQLGGGIYPDTWEIGQFFENITTVSGNINAALSKVGADQYTEFFQGNNTWAWTSSDFSSMIAVNIDSGVDDGLESGSFRFYNSTGTYKTSQIPVRPFLAF